MLSLVRPIWRSLLAASLAIVLDCAGCAFPRASIKPDTQLTSTTIKAQTAVPSPSGTVVAAAHIVPAPPADPVPGELLPEADSRAPSLVEDGDLFAGRESLDVEELVELVHERNPSLQAMYAAWEAAAARYPQEISLDDPMLDLMMAPASFGSNSNVPATWSVEASQKLPWFGKRGFRGRIANANASAAALDADDMRLQLALATRLAYADFVLASRTLELNATEKKLLEELRSVAQSKYETNQGPQQDVLQANVEQAEVMRRQIEFRRGQRLAVARINTLLHRTPLAPLPIPTQTSLPALEVPDEERLFDMAVQVRPDLSALASRIDAEQAAYCLAMKEFHPDIELYGRHDRYWLDSEQQNTIGLKVNLPIRRQRRWAALQEAQARLSKAEADYQSRLAQVRLEVTSAYQRLIEARESDRLLQDEIIKAAEQNVASARAGYEAGSAGFLVLVAAQRQLLDFLQKQAAITAEYQRQLAELERAVGAPLLSRTDVLVRP